MPKKVSKPKKGSKPKESSKAKKGNIPSPPSIGLSVLQDRALELLGSKPGGIYQSELRKLLGVDSARCSRVVSRLETAKLIDRQPADYGSRRTYLISLNGLPLPCTSPCIQNGNQPGSAPQPAKELLVNEGLKSANPGDAEPCNNYEPCNISWPSFAPPARDSRLHYIDTYLTEFYLEYLLRDRGSA